MGNGSQCFLRQCFLSLQIKIAQFESYYVFSLQVLLIWMNQNDYRLADLTPTYTSRILTCLQYKSFENTVGKGEIARNEQFLLCPQCFLPIWRRVFFFFFRKCRLQIPSVWNSLKFVVWEMITTPLTPEIKKGPIGLLEGSLKQNVGKEVGDRLTELKCIVRRFFSWDFKVFCKIISVRSISGSAFAGSLSSQTTTESCFHHPLFDLRGTRKVKIRHTNFHFSSKKVTSKSRKVKVFDLIIVKKLSTFRPKKAKVEKLKSRKVEKLKRRKVEKSFLVRPHYNVCLSAPNDVGAGVDSVA